LHSLFWT